MGFLAWIVVGLIAGWLAGQVMKGGGYRNPRRHHSGHPRGRRGWLGLWDVGNVAGGRPDWLHHRGVCRCDDFGLVYPRIEKGVRGFRAGSTRTTQIAFGCKSSARFCVVSLCSSNASIKRRRIGERSLKAIATRNPSMSVSAILRQLRIVFELPTNHPVRKRL
jgi:Predicted membrane protein